MKGIVVKSTGSWITVLNEEGRKTDCKLKGQFRIRGLRSTNPVAIGDHVIFEIMPDKETGLITEILERENYIIRKATKLSKITHILAANIDHAYLIVTLALPRTSTGFIDRFLVTATGYFIPASLIFNKRDLYDPELEEQEKMLKEIYTDAGYPCYSVSALRGDNIDDLRTHISSKVSLFAGYSGAGKSALIHALDPSINPIVGEISQVHHKGRHTTTFAEMYEVSSGGFIIDTPGIKEFGLIDFEKQEIPRCFPEMDRLLPFCQYANCTHTHEPNCAVKTALKTGKVSRLRYSSYISILNDETER
ncbi:MAG: ribosome small subunit-dependent GTPase A [Bacteroidota bacterium]|nr:ribosome small subunit-dependent GTPase A [Bacteroidota bacterium]